ncbi:collagen alpha-1(I) chain-like [Phyllostomus hastatus]|uniref:collagen alpha-1(I) chain-like n=1 Tax=Phyllostomus hastatus TaxID=9423 RepID=UPI001E6824A7|nr:collagen alpha-1(I) chain-like [Phyllostomus hastatus]
MNTRYPPPIGRSRVFRKDADGGRALKPRTSDAGAALTCSSVGEGSPAVRGRGGSAGSAPRGASGTRAHTPASCGGEPAGEGVRPPGESRASAGATPQTGHPAGPRGRDGDAGQRGVRSTEDVFGGDGSSRRFLGPPHVLGRRLGEKPMNPTGCCRLASDAQLRALGLRPEARTHHPPLGPAGPRAAPARRGDARGVGERNPAVGQQLGAACGDANDGPSRLPVHPLQAGSVWPETRPPAPGAQRPQRSTHGKRKRKGSGWTCRESWGRAAYLTAEHSQVPTEPPPDPGHPRRRPRPTPVAGHPGLCGGARASPGPAPREPAAAQASWGPGAEGSPLRARNPDTKSPLQSRPPLRAEAGTGAQGHQPVPARGRRSPRRWTRRQRSPASLREALRRQRRRRQRARETVQRKHALVIIPKDRREASPTPAFAHEHEAHDRSFFPFFVLPASKNLPPTSPPKNRPSPGSSSGRLSLALGVSHTQGAAQRQPPPQALQGTSLRKWHDLPEPVSFPGQRRRPPGMPGGRRRSNQAPGKHFTQGPPSLLRILPQGLQSLSTPTSTGLARSRPPADASAAAGLLSHPACTPAPSPGGTKVPAAVCSAPRCSRFRASAPRAAAAAALPEVGPSEVRRPRASAGGLPRASGREHTRAASFVQARVEAPLAKFNVNESTTPIQERGLRCHLAAPSCREAGDRAAPCAQDASHVEASCSDRQGSASGPLRPDPPNPFPGVQPSIEPGERLEEVPPGPPLHPPAILSFHTKTPVLTGPSPETQSLDCDCATPFTGPPLRATPMLGPRTPPTPGRGPGWTEVRLEVGGGGGRRCTEAPPPPGQAPRRAHTCPLAAATLVTGGGEPSVPQLEPTETRTRASGARIRRAGDTRSQARGEVPSPGSPRARHTLPARVGRAAASPRAARPSGLLAGLGTRRLPAGPRRHSPARRGRRSVLSGRAGPLTPPGRRRPRGPRPAACAPRLRARPPPPAGPARAAGPRRACSGPSAGGGRRAHVRRRPGSARSRRGGWTALRAAAAPRAPQRPLLPERARPAAHSLTRRRRCASVRRRGERRRRRGRARAASAGRTGPRGLPRWPSRALPASPTPGLPAPRGRGSPPRGDASGRRTQTSFSSESVGDSPSALGSSRPAAVVALT